MTAALRWREGQAYQEAWLCVRGPGGEVETYPADVSEGRFEVKV
ncbi:MAG: hypothetical protein ACOX42_07160 [Clostridia bacterium]